ncbi:Crp/Fnr family transcriptional regulator [Roseiconus nitratireducens]|uniref:Crp/Fnr family transcriptional regulator n=1 Tax=Roseiconus nitratireducens TaxID=2605748 RepID=A0A5M6D9Z0_9BACT|nr:Crp/Fnr family transcriptional regulator [Roseiconus nitratireducens]KAA5544361.1 Crp/Fnr family transcriptional regulator [Roseiconus nitratireducens]
MATQSVPRRLELLRAMPIFGGLKDETLQLVLEHSQQREFETDDYFFCEGDPGEFIYVLESGTALVERTWKGEPIILARLGPGDCFGEMSLIDLQPRLASIRAESECLAIEIPYRVFVTLCRQDTEQYAVIMMNLGREVSRRLRIAGERLFRFQQELGQQWFDEDLTGDG